MNQRVRAIIIQENRVLLIKRIKKDETYWVFPGGGIEQGETNEHALSRECKEELGVKIRIGKLFTERPSDKLETAGQVEFFYFVDITGGTLGAGNGPEFQSDSNYSGQYELQWVGLDKISEMNIKPVEIRNMLSKFYKHTIE